jgi:hypothetical protein
MQSQTIANPVFSGDHAAAQSVNLNVYYGESHILRSVDNHSSWPNGLTNGGRNGVEVKPHCSKPVMGLFLPAALRTLI